MESVWDTHRLGKPSPVLLSRGHGVDHHLFTALKNKDAGLQYVGLRVEAEAQFPMGPHIVFNWLYPLWPSRCLASALLRYPVLKRAGVDFHTANWAKARRIASDRDRCSRPGISSNLYVSSALVRTSRASIDLSP